VCTEIPQVLLFDIEYWFHNDRKAKQEGLQVQSLHHLAPMLYLFSSIVKKTAFGTHIAL
jgi:hypothetical protein